MLIISHTNLYISFASEHQRLRHESASLERSTDDDTLYSIEHHPNARGVCGASDVMKDFVMRITARQKFAAEEFNTSIDILIWSGILSELRNVSDVYSMHFIAKQIDFIQK